MNYWYTQIDFQNRTLFQLFAYRQNEICICNSSLVITFRLKKILLIITFIQHVNWQSPNMLPSLLLIKVLAQKQHLFGCIFECSKMHSLKISHLHLQTLQLAGLVHAVTITVTNGTADLLYLEKWFPYSYLPPLALPLLQPSPQQQLLSLRGGKERGLIETYPIYA